MGVTSRKIAIFIALIFYLLSLSLVVCSFLTEYWVISGVSSENGEVTGRSRVNVGLLSGMRELDWGLGVRYIPFSVLGEIQSDVSFYNRILWIFILFFIALGILWICVGIVTSILSSFTPQQDSIAGPIGIYLWSLLALLSLTASCIMFYIQFHTTMQKNLLTAEQIQAGYSTQGLAKLGSSFYFMLGALVALYFPPLFVFISTDSGTDGKLSKIVSTDPTALLY
ncbi:hypothetical protein RB195_025607 [Necator americanus]|uniref:Uncharacterized protein n=1 Tax=Necator americanus TaxID=51031 RepID=A0ABR1EV60_NECAM